MEQKEKMQFLAFNYRPLLVTLKGITPLLMNAWAERDLEGIELKQTQAAVTASKKGKAPRDPEREWKEHLYVIPGTEDEYYIPGRGIKKCFINAGMRQTEWKGTELRGVFSISGEYIRITDFTGPVMDRQAGKLNGKISTLVYRPRFDKWSIQIPIEYNANAITTENLLSIIGIAGRAIGFCAYRPECSGTYGQFTLMNAEERNEHNE